MNIGILKKDRMNAMKAKETIKKEILGTLLGELDRIGKDPNEKEIIGAIKKMVKNNQEIINCGLGDMTIIENEIKILESYLPKQMTEAEVTLLINSVLNENPDAKGGRLVGLCVKAANGMADSKLISKIIMSK